MFKPRHVFALIFVAAGFLGFYLWFGASNPQYKVRDSAAEAFVRSSPEVVSWLGPIKSIRTAKLNSGRSSADWDNGGPKCLRTVVVLIVEGETKTSRIRIGMSSLDDGPWELRTLTPQTVDEALQEREGTYGFGCR